MDELRGGELAALAEVVVILEELVAHLERSQQRGGRCYQPCVGLAVGIGWVLYLVLPATIDVLFLTLALGFDGPNISIAIGA